MKMFMLVFLYLISSLKESMRLKDAVGLVKLLFDLLGIVQLEMCLALFLWNKKYQPLFRNGARGWIRSLSGYEYFWSQSFPPLHLSFILFLSL